MWSLARPLGDRVVVKLSTPAATTREADALRRVAAAEVAPEALWHRPGTLICRCLAGAPVPLAAASSHDLRTLGRLVRRVHDLADPPPTAVYDGWSTVATSLVEYRLRRAADLSADPILAAAGAATEHAMQRLVSLPPPGGAPFRALHGDLWSGNVVWHRHQPRLVDWEYWRPGEPAEELAYLAAMDDLSPAAVAAILAGYGVGELAPHIDAWRPLLAAECATWLAADGRQTHARALRAQVGRLLG